MNKYANTALKASIPVALIGALAFSIPIFANERNGSVAFGASPEVKGDISFALVELPSGFSEVEGRSTEGFAPLKVAQSLGPWMNADKTCKLTPTVESLPDNFMGQDEDFSSKKYIYDEAEKYDYVQSETKDISLKRTAGDPLAAFYASYEIPNDASLSDDINSGNYYRTTVSRVISKSVPFAEDANVPDSKNRKGVPAIILNYDCLTKDDFKENEFKKITGAVNIDLETDHSNEIPAKAKENQVPSQIDDPSDDLEYGYTVIPEKFDNPGDVVDKGRDRGAADTGVIETDPEQVQPTTPAWQQ